MVTCVGDPARRWHSSTITTSHVFRYWVRSSLLKVCTVANVTWLPIRTFPAVSAEELIRSGRSHSETRAKIAFLSPCAFKQSGRYTIFPQENLILQSLITHWNTTFPEYALTDSDALQALQQGLHIVDFNLHTTRYLLKETRIPSFLGNVTVEAHLAPPLLELWNTLLSFAPYGGIGIKTTLGMGGTTTAFQKRNFCT